MSAQVCQLERVGSEGCGKRLQEIGMSRDVKCSSSCSTLLANVCSARMPSFGMLWLRCSCFQGVSASEQIMNRNMRDVNVQRVTLYSQKQWIAVAV